MFNATGAARATVIDGLNGAADADNFLIGNSLVSSEQDIKDLSFKVPPTCKVETEVSSGLELLDGSFSQSSILEASIKFGISSV